MELEKSRNIALGTSGFFNGSDDTSARIRASEDMWFRRKI
jgi:hypothetical protein